MNDSKFKYRKFSLTDEDLGPLKAADAPRKGASKADHHASRVVDDHTSRNADDHAPRKADDQAPRKADDQASLTGALYIVAFFLKITISR